MCRAVFRLLGLPLAVSAAVALTTLDPTRLAGAAGEVDVYEAAGDPELTTFNHELSAKLDAVAIRTAQKEELIERLLAGRAGLAATADEFLRLNAQPPECVTVIRQFCPASDARESAALNVLEYAYGRADAAAWPAVRARLAAEYRAAFHHDLRQ